VGYNAVYSAEIQPTSSGSNKQGKIPTWKQVANRDPSGPVGEPMGTEVQSSIFLRLPM
jgi:hypothetical protein